MASCWRMQVPSMDVAVYKVCDATPVKADVACIGSHQQKMQSINMEKNRSE